MDECLQIAHCVKKIYNYTFFLSNGGNSCLLSIPGIQIMCLKMADVGCDKPEIKTHI